MLGKIAQSAIRKFSSSSDEAAKIAAKAIAGEYGSFTKAPQKVSVTVRTPGARNLDQVGQNLAAHLRTHGLSAKNPIVADLTPPARSWTLEDGTYSLYVSADVERISKDNPDAAFQNSEIAQEFMEAIATKATVYTAVEKTVSAHVSVPYKDASLATCEGIAADVSARLAALGFSVSNACVQEVVPSWQSAGDSRKYKFSATIQPNNSVVATDPTAL